MSATAWAGWLDRLEAARAQEQVLAAKIRAGDAAAIGTSVFALQQGVARLSRDFEQLRRAAGSSVCVLSLSLAFSQFLSLFLTGGGQHAAGARAQGAAAAAARAGPGGLQALLLANRRCSG